MPRTVKQPPAAQSQTPRKTPAEQLVEQIAQQVTQKLTRQIAQLSTKNTDLSGKGFMTLDQVRALLPISPSRWHQGVREGEFPKPVHLYPGAKASFYRVTEIEALLDKLSNGVSTDVSTDVGTDVGTNTKVIPTNVNISVEQTGAVA